MSSDRRSDLLQAQRIDAAIRIDALWGCVSAWHYLRSRGTARGVALRVLGRGGPRRRSDSPHPAARDAMARGPDDGMDQRAASTATAAEGDSGESGDTGAATPRSNVAAAYAVERAIGLAATEGRQYAESLLRLYGLPTATVMRVLFEPHRRRRAAPPASHVQGTPPPGVR